VKVLLDSCVWGGANAVIAAGGHAVEWVGDWPADPGDEEILAYAASSRAVLITIDKDFGELAVVRGLPPADQRAVLKLVDAMLAARRRSTPAPRSAKRKAS